MKLSLSVRVGEKYFSKREAAISLPELADIAVASGYHALCMRASQIGIHTPRDEIAGKARLLRERSLAVSMVTGDFPIPENTDEGPQALRNIAPYLDLAEALGSSLVRVALRGTRTSSGRSAPRMPRANAASPWRISATTARCSNASTRRWTCCAASAAPTSG